MYKKKLSSFINLVENSTVYMISQQRKAAPFQIKVLKKSGKMGFEVEPRVMPIDTFFAFEVFNYVLHNADKAVPDNMRLLHGLNTQATYDRRLRTVKSWLGYMAKVLSNV